MRGQRQQCLSRSSAGHGRAFAHLALAHGSPDLPAAFTGRARQSSVSCHRTAPAELVAVDGGWWAAAHCSDSGPRGLLSVRARWGQGAPARPPALHPARASQLLRAQRPHMHGASIAHPLATPLCPPCARLLTLLWHLRRLWCREGVRRLPSGCGGQRPVASEPLQLAWSGWMGPREHRDGPCGD